ncbi:hypothetical protein [Paludisphaera soli]|uniref:hypothetical protein n=1 Tax=Paludisphaera soli TaxID=2712865 RepID=UPI0013EC9E76|nr:hypothetical protein [Paludisphaera soli]
MHSQNRRKRLSAAGLSLLAAAALAAPRAASADDTGLFGRLFRLGGANSSRSKPAPLPYGGDGEPGAPNGPGNGRNPGPKHDHDHDHDHGANAFVPPAGSRGPASPPTPPAGPSGEGPSTPAVAESGPAAPPITPRSRVSNAATDADPLLTRMALGRSNDGGQFGMFLQIYADGTVIDSEGVHRLAPADLRPIAELVSSGELGRNRGHCGTPSSDYIEEVHVVVFERRLGRLTAQPFSYSGNPQGCDPSVRQLHTLIEGLQAKLSGQPVAASTPASVVEDAAAAGPASPPLAAPAAFAAPSRTPLAAPGVSRVLPPLPATSAPVIPLTPADSR